MFATDNISSRSHDKERDGRNRSLRHRIPYRLLGRRSMGTKRLVLSSKVLLSSIPTHNCDVVLTFPANIEDSTLMWLLARLKSRKPALTVSVRHHNNSGIYGFYLTADYDSLLQGAEELALVKPLKSEYGGGMKEFVVEDQDCFAGVEDEESFLTSQERQSIVMQFLNDLRATGDDSLNGIKFVESQPVVPMLKTKKIISQVFPLHNSTDLKELRQTWVQALLSPQPLDLVCRYFGVKIALYFAYLGHYTTWLITPAFFGLFIFLLQGTDQFMEDVCFLCFALFNVIWASLYLKFWNRASTEFSYRMGTLERKDDLLKDPRPLFEGELTKSLVTGHLEPTYPAWKRSLFFYTITSPIIGLCLLTVFITMLLCFELQEWVNELIASSDLPYIFSFGPKILLAVVVSIMDEIYKDIALWLTHKENYRLEESFETNLVVKLVLFQFVNSFLSLFYIGFYLGDMDRLRDQLAALLITRQVLGNVKETLMPYIMWKAKLYSFGYRIATKMSPASVEKEVRKMTTKSGQKKPGDAKSADGGKKVVGKHSDDESSTMTEEEDEGIPSLTQAEVESAMRKYEDTLDDYLEMCIQFGYITLFSSAFPLAAMCALVNNIIEIRSDAFKLCLTYQRPFGKRVENIGIWQDVLMSFSVLAVIVNSILIGTTGLLSRLMPGLTPTASILVLVIIEHLIVTLKLAIARAIPDMPQTISTETAKLEHQRREALKQLETQTPPIQTMSQNAPDSPGRRRGLDGIHREPPSVSPMASPVNSSVITHSSFIVNSSDMPQPTSSNAATSQCVLPPLNAPKPEVPVRMSLLRKDEGPTKPLTIPSTEVAENVTAANVDAKNSSATSTTGANLPLRVQLRKRVKPGVPMGRDSDSLNQKYLKRRLDFDARRGMSDPLSGAVSLALELHKDSNTDKTLGPKEGGSGNYQRSSHRTHHAKQKAGDPSEISKDRRQDLFRRSLQNLAQREELRRTSSLKHNRRANETSGDSSAVAPPHVPPPTIITANSRRTSPPNEASVRTKGETYYPGQILSRRLRSLSSENVNEPRSFSWKDRHSWKAESSSFSSSSSSVGNKQTSYSTAVPLEGSKPVSAIDSITIDTIANKPPSGHVTEGKFHIHHSADDAEKNAGKACKSDSTNIMNPTSQNVITASSGSYRAVRDSSNQPLSISTKNLSVE